jgi:hypothetical protein
MKPFLSLLFISFLGVTGAPFLPSPLLSEEISLSSKPSVERKGGVRSSLTFFLPVAGGVVIVEGKGFPRGGAGFSAEFPPTFLSLPPSFALRVGGKILYHPLFSHSLLTDPTLPSVEPLDLKGNTILQELTFGVFYRKDRYFTPFLEIGTGVRSFFGTLSTFSGTDRLQDHNLFLSVRGGNEFSFPSFRWKITAGYTFSPARLSVLGKGENLEGVEFQLEYLIPL